MGILDELRKRADEKKVAQYQQKLLEKKLERTYKSVLLPKMQYLYNNINEIIKHLNFLEEPVIIRNYSSKYPQFGKLFQKNYKINTDGRYGLGDYNRLMQINVSFNCEAEGSFSYTLTTKQLIDKEFEFLYSRGLIFEQKDQIHSTSAKFTVQRKIPVRFKIQVDYKQSRLKVGIYNHENFETFYRSFTPEQLDDDFLDAFFSYFLRRNNRFVQPDISDEHKAALLNHIATCSQQEQADLLTENAFGETDANLSKTASPLKSIFAKYLKKNNRLQKQG